MVNRINTRSPTNTWLIHSKSIFERTLRYAFSLAGVLMVFSMLAVCAAITIRYITGQDIFWVIEVCAIIVLYITFLGAGWVMKLDQHVKVDIIFEAFSPRIKRSVNIFNSIMGALVFMAVAWFGAKYTLIFLQKSYHAPTTMGTPDWIVTIVIPIGSILLFIQLWRVTYNLLKKK